MQANPDFSSATSAVAAAARAEDCVYTIREVAHDARIGRSTLWNWIAKGRVATIKIGAGRRITAAERRRILSGEI